MRTAFDADGVSLPKGALVAFREGAKPQVIFAPGARQSIESVGTGRDKIYAVITDNVIGAVHVFTPGPKAGGWSDKVLSLPGQGSADIVSANDYGPEAMFSFQNYLTPTTLYFDGGNDQPKPRSNRCRRVLMRRAWSPSNSRPPPRTAPKFPISSPGRKTLNGPAPTILYGYGGFEVSLTPSYSANFGRLWLEPWRHLCGGQYPRRRRIRAGLA